MWALEIWEALNLKGEIRTLVPKNHNLCLKITTYAHFPLKVDAHFSQKVATNAHFYRL